MIKFSVPLQIYYSPKKKLILNLNNFRNAHYHVLNKAKIAFHKLVGKTLPKKRIEPPVTLKIEIWHGSARKFDLANVCSIIDKFVCDTIVEYGILPDDNIDYIARTEYVYMGIDRDNPRAEIEICSL